MGIEHGDTSTDSQLRTLITSLAAIDDPIIKDIIITHIRTSPNFPLVS